MTREVGFGMTLGVFLIYNVWGDVFGRLLWGILF